MTKETIYSADPTLENLLDWTDSLISPVYHTNFDQVARTCATIQKLILIINGGTVNSALKLAKLYVKVRKSTSFRIQSPKLYAVIMHRHESSRIFVVEFYVCAFLVVLVSCELTCL